MKNIITVAILLATIFTSCLTSLHPLVTPDRVTTDNRVVGTWITDGDTVIIERFLDSETYSMVKKLGSVTGISRNAGQSELDSIMYPKGYCVSYRKDGVDYFMFGALIRIDKDLYLDLLPIIADDPNNKEGTGYEYTNDYLPTFTMAKIEISSSNNMTLHFVNGDFIRDQVRKGNVRIKHEQNPLFETFMVTASSKELQQFISKYGHDDRLFNKENSVTLTRKG
jgi:hypothetical protein